MSRNLSKIGRLAGLACAVSLALTACGDGDNGAEEAAAPSEETNAATTEVLRVAVANHPWTDYIKERIPEFEEEHGVKVDLSSFQADQLSTMYNVRLNAQADDLDVMMYRPLQEALQFSRNGWLLELTDYAEGEFNIDDFQESMMNTLRYEDGLYGVPIVTEREVLFYRKDLFAEAGLEAPATMEELEEAAAALHDPDSGLFGYGMRGMRSPAVTQFSGFLYSHGGDFITDGEASVNTPEAVQAYETYGRLLREYGPVGVESMSTEQLNPLFQQGKLAMYIDAEVFWSELIKEGTSTIAEEDLGVAPLPAGPAGSHPYSVPSWGLGINKNSPNADMAWEFIDWAVSEEMVLDLQKAGVFGARNSVWENPESLSGIPEDFAETMRVSTENGIGHDRPLVVQVGRARDIVGGPLVVAIQGGDVQKAADEAQAELEKFLEEDATATGAES